MKRLERSPVPEHARAPMISCSDLLDDYSDYRDGLMTEDRSSLMEEHLAACESCASYDAVFSRGILELRGLPRIEPSYDFLPRLQHRIYNLDEEASRYSRSYASGTSAGFVALLVMVLAAVAWIPMIGDRSSTVELPPVAAVVPQPEQSLPPLFQESPLLGSSNLSFASGRSNDLFFRYTSLGSNFADPAVHTVRR